MNLLAGTSGYSYPKWKGSFYPAKLPAKQMLHFYGTQFSTVEINSTFYGPPKPSALETWCGAVPAYFRFVLKAPQQITHIKRLQNASDEVAQFLDAAASLGERLGPLLFQLPPNMKKDTARLRAFLALLPAERRIAFEFRHQSWFEDDVIAALREHGAALCIAEAENDLDTPFEATADWGYLRLRRPDYDDAELTTWAKRVKKAKWREAFVFFKHEDEGKGPRMAKRFLELASPESRAA